MQKREEWLWEIREKSINMDMLLECLTLERLAGRTGRQVKWRDLNSETLNEVMQEVQNQTRGLEGVFTHLSRKNALNQILKTPLLDLLEDMQLIGMESEIEKFFMQLLEEMERRECGLSLVEPESIVKLLGGLLDTPEKQTTLYDPAIGTGSLVLQVAKNKKIAGIVGKDISSESIRLCKMLAAVSGFTESLEKLRTGDSSRAITPRTPEEDRRQYDFIMGTLPFLQEDSRKMTMLMNIAHQLSQQGQAVIVTGNSVLFKERPYETLRKIWLESNIIDCIIQLPAKILKGSSQACAVIVLRKKRTHEGILFMDLTGEVGKISKALTVLSEAIIQKAEHCYKEYEEIQEFSKIVSRQEIEAGQNVLQVSRYIGKEKENLCPASINEEIKSLQQELRSIQEKIEELLIG